MPPCHKNVQFRVCLVYLCLMMNADETLVKRVMSADVGTHRTLDTALDTTLMKR